MKTIRIRPAAGIILAGIPKAGADVDAELAREWIAGRLAVEVIDTKTKPDRRHAPAVKPADTEG